MTILEASKLSAGYGDGDVIHDIDLRLESGEFVCILGPNGSGKSTLVRAVQGLLDHVSGEVRVLGQNMFHLKRDQIARTIAFVPQMADPAFEFTVFELVAMGRYVHQNRFSGLCSADRQLIHEALEMVEIAPLREKKVAHLSGGERQRALIARALAQDTPFLVLDEPSSHLDLNFGLGVFAILSKLQTERKKTVLCTEHNINLVIPYAQKLLFIKGGKIVARGDTAAMITRGHIKDVFEVDVDIRENRYSRLPEISLIPKYSPKPPSPT